MAGIVAQGGVAQGGVAQGGVAQRMAGGPSEVAINATNGGSNNSNGAASSAGPTGSVKRPSPTDEQNIKLNESDFDVEDLSEEAIRATRGEGPKTMSARRFVKAKRTAAKEKMHI